MLTEQEKQLALRLARNSIADRLGLATEELPPSMPPALQGRKGVFVSLHKKGELRGCIGNIVGRDALFIAIADLALESAFGDPRFSGLKPEEFSEIDIEISVLTELKKIQRPEEIEVGKHGLYLKKGFHSGLLLPQVAVEQQWDRMTFLEQTCWKAGLPRDAWRQDAEIFVFGAEVFGEKDLRNENAD
jgi:AmmeMemoRadiSam system protein A